MAELLRVKTRDWFLVLLLLIAFKWNRVSSQENGTIVDSDLTLGFAIRDFFCYAEIQQTQLAYLFNCSASIGVSYQDTLIKKCPQYETQDFSRMYETVCMVEGNSKIPQNFVPALECFGRTIVPPETLQSDPQARQKVANGLRECRQTAPSIAY